MAAAQALLLADPRPRDANAARAEAAADRRLPTFSAFRALVRPHLLVFTAAVVLLQMASSVHTAYYALYLTDVVHLDKKWVGQASNVAVFIEIFFVSGCGWLVARLGVKRLLLVAMLASALRYGLVASSDHAAVAIGTQAFHGIFLVAVGVLPQIILDANADDRFRHSMQGVFVMLTGGGRVLSSRAAGLLAAGGIGRLYGYAAALCLVAAGLVLFLYREPARETAAPACDDAAAAETPPSPVPTEVA
jgi:predicted MFS family arabinose efflux permease